MNDRLLTAVCAVGALALIWSMLSRPEIPVTAPLSTESGDSGYRGLRVWLEGEGVRVLSLQRRFDAAALADAALPPAGNILLTTLPHKNPLRAAEVIAIQSWVERGNTLLVLAAFDETPKWTEFLDGARLPSDMLRLTRLSFEERDDDRRLLDFDTPVEAESTLELLPAARHRLLDGVERVFGYSDFASSLWEPEANAPSDQPVLRLMNERASGYAAMWQIGPATAAEPRAHVGGTVIVSASAAFLTNRKLGEGDARRFVANLLEHHLAADGVLVFDDMHQGLTTLYDARAFFADPRLHATLMFVFAAWLAWILGSSNRLAAPRPVVAEPRQRDFLAAAGGFMARRLDRRAAGLLLMNEWFDEIRRRRSLPASAEPPWAELEATPALDEELYRELRQAHERLDSGRPVGLPRLHNILRHAREAIG